MSLKYIKNRWGAEFQVPVCKSRGTGCRFCASPNHKHVIFDCDKIRLVCKIAGKMCDCIIIEHRGMLYVGVVELKGTSYSVPDVRSQLEAGIRLAKRMLRDSNCQRYVLLPIFVAPTFQDSNKVRRLKQCSLVIDGEQLTIRLAKCRKNFSDIVPTA